MSNSLASLTNQASSPLDQVRQVIAVCSNKGGVGKSTTAVGLAAALARRGRAVGLVDLDISGPNVPRALGLADDGGAYMDADEVIHPARVKDVLGTPGTELGVLSAGMFLDPGAAVAWRGPKVAGAADQLLGQAAWNDYDSVIIDMPPGTGDVALSAAAHTRAAVLVTSAESSALDDVERSVDLYRQLGVPVLGLVETLSTVQCECGRQIRIHGDEFTMQAACRDMGIDLLGHIPIVPVAKRGSAHPAAAPEVMAAMNGVAEAVQLRADVLLGPSKV